MKDSGSVRVLLIIIISQFFCTSLWFAGNGVLSDLVSVFELDPSALQHLTSAVQFGFITGTLIYAFFNLADRFSPSMVFCVSAILAGLANLISIGDFNTLTTLLISRFGTGFFLAGIYPVGMKIAADWFDQGLGRSLGFLVGALVLGTALPHLLNTLSWGWSWKAVLISTSTLALIGGILIALLVPDGPYRKAGQKLQLGAIFKVFRKREFRKAAFGYFGHMWELYAFWAFVPVIIRTYTISYPTQFSITFWSFVVIAVGAVSCAVGGVLSFHAGPRRVALSALITSGSCCLISPLIFELPLFLFLTFLSVWGMAVIADSPMFSTLVAYNADPEIKGTALTIVNCIGFAMTIVSIQLLGWLLDYFNPKFVFVSLMLGPVFGLLSMKFRSSE